MKIPIKVHYAVSLMLHLALNYGKGPLLLSEIAEKENISEKYLGQIIIPLKAAGFINSLRGAHGGYMLSRPPLRLTVKEIVEALQGNLNLFNDINGSFSDSKALFCMRSLVWERLEKNISDALEAVSLEDLARAYIQNGKNDIMYNI